MSTTHVAGLVVKFRVLDRVIQRCAVCGEKLEDLRPSRIAVCSTDDRGLPVFGEGRLVEVIDGNPRSFIDCGDFETAELPENFCLALVER